MLLVSLNVALFETNNEKLYQFLLKQEPDIVCLQEVAQSADPNVDQAYLSKGYIDQATQKLKYSFFGPTWEIRDFHQKNFHQQKSFDFEFGGFLKSGNYIKTRFKILKRSNVFISHKNIKVTDWSSWPKNQSKAVQIVDLKLPNLKKLRVLNYHGIWTKEKIGNKETLDACKKISQLATEVDYPTIITGDFNLFPDTQSMQVFQDNFISLVDKHNIPTTRPKTNELNHLDRNVVDYILVSKAIKVNLFKVLDTDVSDHLPLVLDVDLP